MLNILPDIIVLFVLFALKEELVGITYNVQVMCFRKYQQYQKCSKCQNVSSIRSTSSNCMKRMPLYRTLLLTGHERNISRRHEKKWNYTLYALPNDFPGCRIFPAGSSEFSCNLSFSYRAFSRTFCRTL